jgi:cysteine desulfurase / selenocysteine lyase
MDWPDFQRKYTERVKVVSLSAASNVTGVIYQLDGIISLLREETFLMIDGSQLVPHAPITMATQTGLTRIDAYIATGHKIMADTWLGMIRLRKPRIKKLSPARGGGGMITDVTRDGFIAGDGIEKFEPGTPHIAGAVSLLYACQYIESIGGYDAIMQHEATLIDYALEKFAAQKQLTLLGPLAPISGSVLVEEKLTRLGIFSFTIKDFSNHKQIGERLALKNIAVRCGWHCTHPLFHSLETQGSCRMSTYVYTEIADIDILWTALQSFFWSV